MTLSNVHMILVGLVHQRENIIPWLDIVSVEGLSEVHGVGGGGVGGCGSV